MRKLRTVLATTATVAAATALPVGYATSAHAVPSHTQPDHGRVTTAGDGFDCPSGDVCLINDKFVIANKYFHYGTYKLSGKYGWWIVDNNQTGDAHVDLCYNSNGTNCFPGPAAGFYRWVDLTPVNSIRLRR
ncbi:hypothetical protein [Actinomadura litoris]|uniref:Peptidase inhibitor family I36 n=1 Tax=Actinomadura litoris TaxID=2678616 RepID=A0A7K1LBQ4_9ACTN|nr:hypothetical protein [Actinomadura litoris]MUN41696.1 hypothetical protein [Actinomadura litoris]